MKIYALTILFCVCIFQNASADWKNDVKINHMQHINSIINDTLSRIRTDVSLKGTPGAQACAENARLELRSISQSGYSGVTSCVNSANNAGTANVCAQKVDQDVFEQALQASKTATTCINNS